MKTKLQRRSASSNAALISWAVLAVGSVSVVGGAVGAQEPAAKAQPAPGERPDNVERERNFTYQDRRIPGAPPRGWRMYISRNARTTRLVQRDPKFNAEYRNHLQVDCITEDPNAPKIDDAIGGDRSAADRRFVVHFPDGEEALARRVGSLLARLYWVGWDYLGRRPSSATHVDVWLTKEGMPGGEATGTNIYLYAIGTPRAPAEWVREIAHEYGHLTLPATGPYSAPERFSNGYLGERLYMKWMLADNAMTNVWSEPIDGNAYVANQIVPLRNTFLNEGPAAQDAQKNPLISKMEPEGMNFYIGQMLALEAAHGPVVLRNIFSKWVSPSPLNLGGYFQRAIAEMKPVVIPVAPAAYIPSRSQPVAGTAGTPVTSGADAPLQFKRVSYWVFLPGGNWRFTLQGSVPANLTANLEQATLQKGATGVPGTLTWETSLRDLNASWRRLDLAAAGTDVIEIRSLTITPAGQVAPAGPTGRPMGQLGFGEPGIIRRPQGNP